MKGIRNRHTIAVLDLISNSHGRTRLKGAIILLQGFLHEYLYGNPVSPAIEYIGILRELKLHTRHGRFNPKLVDSHYIHLPHKYDNGFPNSVETIISNYIDARLVEAQEGESRISDRERVFNIIKAISLILQEYLTEDQELIDIGEVIEQRGHTPHNWLILALIDKHRIGAKIKQLQKDLCYFARGQEEAITLFRLLAPLQQAKRAI